MPSGKLVDSVPNFHLISYDKTISVDITDKFNRITALTVEKWTMPRAKQRSRSRLPERQNFSFSSSPPDYVSSGNAPNFMLLFSPS
jgi:hypothetical protein